MCECGEIIDGDTFKDYIKTSSNPSTVTFGHCRCGLIFNKIDGKGLKKYSSKKELKIIAARFAHKRNLNDVETGKFLAIVDRIKSSGNYSDAEVMVKSLNLYQCGCFNTPEGVSTVSS